MGKLSSDSEKALLHLARSAIDKRLGGSCSTPEKVNADLSEIRGTFVTLKINNQLRGCIGNILPVGSIWDSVKNNAVSAAFADSRFPELSRDELQDTTISISVLTDPEDLDFKDSLDLCNKLHPYVDGVILRKGAHSATFLPQVWDQLPDVELFLTHLCRKAGLSGDCWKSDEIQIQVYQVQNFSEV